MKKEFIAIILAILIVNAFNIYSIYAKSEQGSLRAGGILSYKISYFDFSISLSYAINYTLNYNDETNRGDYNDIKITLQGGHANLTFQIGNNTLTYNRTLKLGEQFNIDANIASFAIILRAEAPVDVQGQATPLSNTLIFENEGQQSIRIKVNDAANVGELVNITLPFKLQIYFSILSPIPTSIIKIGEISMTPQMKAQFKVTEDWLSRNLYYIIAIVIALILILAAIFLLRRRKK